MKFLDFTNQSETIQKAYRIACRAHAGQKDKSGKDYILHPMTVASHVGSDENCIVTALLHDVAEDTEITLEELSCNFNEEVMQALKLLTHQDGVPYMDYVKNLKDNRIARTVKLADLRHNMDLSRLPEITEKDLQRVEKYKKAERLLMEADNKAGKRI